MASSDARSPMPPPLPPPIQPIREVPVITTDRLTLRGHWPEDFADCFAMWSDPDVTRYIGGRPHTEEEAWSRLLRYAGHWTLMGFGYWLVRETASGAFVGEVGFAEHRRTIVPSIVGTPEMGWILMPSAQGRGLATEAVRAAIAWGESHFGSARMACLIDRRNTRSVRIAEKVGFRVLAETTYKDEPVTLFER